MHRLIGKKNHHILPSEVCQFISFINYVEVTATRVT